MNFYAVELSIGLLKQIREKTYVSETKTYASFSSVQKEMKNLLQTMYDLFKTNFYEPRATYLIIIKKEFDDLLKEILAQINSFDPELKKLATTYIPFIGDALKAWNELFKKKIAPFVEGNQYLKELPMHKNSDRFYIMVKELNPLNLTLKHPYIERQSKPQAKRSTRDIITFDRIDPIRAKRMFDKEDRLNAPGSKLFILDGHHRLYELYKRYLKGKLDGNTLIEVVKG